MNNVKRIGLQP